MQWHINLLLKNNIIKNIKFYKKNLINISTIKYVKYANIKIVEYKMSK